MNAKEKRLWMSSRLRLTPPGQTPSAAGAMLSSKRSRTSKNTSKPNDAPTLEQIGYVAGGVYAGGLYALTAPVTLLDGPLPFVDAAWAIGFGVAVTRGSAAGGKAGRFADEALTYL